MGNKKCSPITTIILFSFVLSFQTLLMVSCKKDPLKEISTLTISDITNITFSSVTVTAEVTSDGGSSIIDRGVCFSTNENPTIGDSKTSDGSGLGTFTSSISGLTLSTTYYVRAYATNSIGTGYSSTNSFTTSSTVSDIDGNVYHTVTIGTQVWMVENLKTTKYRNRDLIPTTVTDSTWNYSTIGLQCDYNNDAALGQKYGKLYNWYAVNDGRNIAPTGWHVATDAEWTTLRNYLATNFGTSGSVAKALAATTDWYSSTVSGAVGNDLAKNNSSGFTALPGGERLSYFDWIGLKGYWWSSTELNKSFAWYQGISGGDGIGRGNNSKDLGFSVRCIMD